jgi:hypothetical protein
MTQSRRRLLQPIAMQHPEAITLQGHAPLAALALFITQLGATAASLCQTLLARADEVIE